MKKGGIGKAALAFLGLFFLFAEKIEEGQFQLGHIQIGFPFIRVIVVIPEKACFCHCQEMVCQSIAYAWANPCGPVVGV